jgi:predicted small metal-binding protein
MKTMTCKQLGGACDQEFHADTFEEISEMSRSHGMEMFQKNDIAHLEAMRKMRELMQSEDSDAMKNWMQSKKEEFDALPDSSPE